MRGAEHPSMGRKHSYAFHGCIRLHTSRPESPCAAPCLPAWTFLMGPLPTGHVTRRNGQWPRRLPNEPCASYPVSRSAGAPDLRRVRLEATALLDASSRSAPMRSTDWGPLCVTIRGSSRPALESLTKLSLEFRLPTFSKISRSHRENYLESAVPIMQV
jgi:hypothetical protein